MKCQKCGDCCTHFRFTLKPSNIELLELIKAHYGDEMDTLNLNIQHRCIRLKEDNTCSIYENRPQICKEFFCEKAKEQK